MELLQNIILAAILLILFFLFCKMFSDALQKNEYEDALHNLEINYEKLENKLKRKDRYIASLHLKLDKVKSILND